MNREILRLSFPNIITNITVPLLGMVDLAIVGHIGDEVYIGAIALGTMIFNLIYWIFGFLRMGVSGLTAQAFGANDKRESMAVMVRGLTIAFFVAFSLIILQYPISLLVRLFIHTGTHTMELTLSYFFIRIWAAPATLGLYVIKGWFIGMQNAKYPMIVAVTLNIVNIVMSLLFVFVFKMDIVGVALGTVLAQYSGLFLAVLLWLKKYASFRQFVDIRSHLQWKEMKHFFSLNGNILLRSLCLILVFTFIPVVSAKGGDLVLAANTLLMQLFTLFSYIMDGFAYAGESLTGRFIGEKNSNNLQKSVRYLLRWGILLALIFTLLYLFFGKSILSLLTNDNVVIEETMRYFVWTLLVPIAGFAAFLFDGIYVGATAAKAMRNIMFVATVCFFVLYYYLTPQIGNNGLWVSFLFFLLMRSALMFVFCRKEIQIKPFVKHEL